MFKQKNQKIFIIFFVIIVVIIILYNIKVLSPVNSIITYFSKSIQIPLHKLNLAIFDANILKDKEELIKENVVLQQKIDTEVVKNKDLIDEMQKNKIIEKQNKYLDNNSLKHIHAEVLSKTIENNDQILYLNYSESNDEIDIGLPVITEEGILIGKVISVQNSIIKVLLITSKTIKVAAQILNEKNTPGIVYGELGISLNMQYIPRQDEIKNDDIVVTSGQEDNIPRGLYIGKITSIKNTDEDLFQSAKVINSVDFSRLSIVSIILP